VKLKKLARGAGYEGRASRSTRPRCAHAGLVGGANSSAKRPDVQRARGLFSSRYWQSVCCIARSSPGGRPKVRRCELSRLMTVRRPPRTETRVTRNRLTVYPRSAVRWQSTAFPQRPPAIANNNPRAARRRTASKDFKSNSSGIPYIVGWRAGLGGQRVRGGLDLRRSESGSDRNARPLNHVDNRGGLHAGCGTLLRYAQVGRTPAR